MALAKKLLHIDMQRQNKRKLIISAHVGDLSFEFLHNFDIVIMSRGPTTTESCASAWSRDEMERINTYCRHRRKIDSKGKVFESPMAFVAADVRGFMGYMISDLGNKFLVCLLIMMANSASRVSIS